MRTLLVLARISNLPTVWSDCLAAFLLSGRGSTRSLLLLCAGTSLLYTGGMFLNDALDQDFDRAHRPERPIVSGKIGPRTVWWTAGGLLLLGCVLLWATGRLSGIFGTLLLLLIVAYDLVHKQTTLAPIIMASCRFMVYLTTAAGVLEPSYSAVLPCAFALACYIVGLSYMARGESTGARGFPWAPLFLLAPVVVAFTRSFPVTLPVALAIAMQVAWTSWCLLGNKFKLLVGLPHGVAGLLAGIALVDALASVNSGGFLLCGLCFVLALLLQRVAPAT